MMQTRQRWQQRANPRDLTLNRQQELLRAKEAREAAADIGIEAVKREVRAEGFSQGWDAAIAWVVKTYGLDTDVPGGGE